MTVDIIKYASIGGEVSENYWGRSDLAKFDVSLAIAENWFVDYHGGLSTSPGYELVDFVMLDEFPTKFFPFRFAANTGNTNLILFGHEYIRFVQDGAYVLEEPQTIVSITKANPGVMTVTGHGWSTDDWIKLPEVGEMVELAGRTIRLSVLTVDTFQLLDVFGNPIDTTNFTTYVSGGEASRIYTLESPYIADDLATLRHSQIRDTIRLTHNNYVTHNLIRNDSADWTLEEENFSNDLERVGALTFSTPGANDHVAAGYVVTWVDENGVESLPSDYSFVTNMSDTNRSTTGTWTPIEGAKFYNIYRTRLTIAGSSEIVSRSMQVGYIGQSRGAHFFDRNITADFTRTPPQNNNPFANGAIIQVDITAGGTLYSNSSTLTVTDPSSEAAGFIGSLMIGTTEGTASGPIVGVLIISGGHDYTAPVFTIGAPGSGATLTAVLSDAEGNDPAVTTVHQQRQVYAATENKPLTVFGSRPGRLSNFNVSDILLANDSYEHELDNQDASPISHLLSVRGGLLVCTASGISLMSGTSAAGVSATDVQVDPQSAEGVADVPPLLVNTDVLYVENGGGKVMQLTYNDVIKLYAGVDLSLLASHMFAADNQITAWGYANNPFKIVHARREDGVMLNFTLIKEQEVFAWTRRTTQGEFEDVITLVENFTSSVYAMVSRYINGRWTKFIERLASRDFDHVEDAFCVDCGLRTTITRPDASMQLAAITGTGVLATASGPVFASTDVGKILRFGAGKARVVSWTNEHKVTVDFIRDLDKVIQVNGEPYPKRARSGQWSLDSEFTTVRGLDHLEGQMVSVLADGNVITQRTVEDGMITLDKAASRVIVGLPYTCIAKNLPLTMDGQVIENKRARIVANAVRVKDTRGLKLGNDLDNLYAMRERTTEAYGEPTELVNGLHQMLLEPIWDDDSQTYIVQEDPLPATVIGYVLEVEVGDDPN